MCLWVARIKQNVAPVICCVLAHKSVDHLPSYGLVCQMIIVESLACSCSRSTRRCPFRDTRIHCSLMEQLNMGSTVCWTESHWLHTPLAFVKSFLVLQDTSETFLMNKCCSTSNRQKAKSCAIENCHANKEHCWLPCHRKSF